MTFQESGEIAKLWQIQHDLPQIVEKSISVVFGDFGTRSEEQNMYNVHSIICTIETKILTSESSDMVIFNI